MQSVFLPEIHRVSIQCRWYQLRQRLVKYRFSCLFCSLVSSGIASRAVASSDGTCLLMLAVLAVLTRRHLGRMKETLETHIFSAIPSLTSGSARSAEDGIGASDGRGGGREGGGGPAAPARRGGGGGGDGGGGEGVGGGGGGGCCYCGGGGGAEATTGWAHRGHTHGLTALTVRSAVGTRSQRGSPCWRGLAPVATPS